MTVKVTLSTYEVETLIREHLERKFAHLATHATEYVAVSFPKRAEPLEVTLEPKRRESNAWD